MIDRILHALTSAETWTNIGAFLVGWALAEVRAWAWERLRLRRWRKGAEQAFASGVRLGAKHTVWVPYSDDLLPLPGDPMAAPAREDDA